MMAFFIVGIIICLASVFVILVQIWITEKNKADILSLYAMLKISDLKKIYDNCDAYLDDLTNFGGPETLLLSQTNK